MTTNKNDIHIENAILQENTNEINLNNDKDIEFNNIDNNVSANINENLEENKELCTTPSTLEEENSEKNDTVETNCLALTVKKDYNLSILKNTISTTFRVTFKITISTIILNFLRMFF